MKKMHIKPVLIIFLIAIIARLLFAVSVYQPFADRLGWANLPGQFEWEGGKSDDYAAIARNLVAGEGYKTCGNDGNLYPSLSRPPVYPSILALQFYLFGEGFWINAIINILYQSLVCIILYYLSLMIFKKKNIAIISSLIWALYPLPMLQTMGPFSESIYALLLVSFAYFFYKFYKLKETRYLIYFSVLMTILTLTRPISIVFPLFFLVITMLNKEFSPGNKIRQIAIFSVIFMIGIVPWTYRTYKITGEVVPLVTYKKPLNYYMIKDQDIDKAELKKGFAGKFAEEIKNPLAYLKNQSIESVQFWYHSHTKRTSIVNAFVQIPLLALSISGIWWARKRRYLIFPILVTICFFWLAYGATHAIARYSLPVITLLCPFAAIGIINLVHTVFKTKSDFFLLQENQ
ncbi:MAG TPA: hypothetical protein ENH01_01990 [Nitrospirae bacterium]|nr:hypothetical protein [Nitrospirota bacterium]